MRITWTPDGHILEHRIIKWSTDQKEIERTILGFYVREFEKTGATFIKIEDGGKGHLDFLLTLPGGKMYLELMEAVIPDAGTLPHQPNTQGHWPLPYADKVFQDVQKKIDKYGLKHRIPISLLIYTTHEQYRPNGAVIDVLRHYFKDREHAFFYVFFLIPIMTDCCSLRVLFNRDHSFDPPPLDELAKRYWMNVPTGSGWTLSET
jgi:hypothetical protein